MSDFDLAKDEIIEMVRREVIDPAFDDKRNWTQVAPDKHKIVLEIADAQFIKTHFLHDLLEHLRSYTIGIMPWDRANDAEYKIDGGRFEFAEEKDRYKRVSVVVSAHLRPLHRRDAVLGFMPDPSLAQRTPPIGAKVNADVAQAIADMM